MSMESKDRRAGRDKMSNEEYWDDVLSHQPQTERGRRNRQYLLSQMQHLKGTKTKTP